MHIVHYLIKNKPVIYNYKSITYWDSFFFVFVGFRSMSFLIVFRLLSIYSCFSLFFKALRVCGLLIDIYFINKGVKSIFKIRWTWDIFEYKFENWQLKY